MLQLIGNTPMVRLNKAAGDVRADILVKLEYLNPSGSIKDRIALQMIEQAEREGRLRPGMEIVEASTGNTAAALALVGAVKGYPVRLFVPETTSEERLKLLESYGARITPVELRLQDAPANAGLHGSVVEIVPRQRCLEEERKRPDKVWWARQFSSAGNSGAHTDTTAREIIEQTDGELDAFVAAVGTGGTVVGVARALRAHVPSARIVAVEPKNMAVIKDGKLTTPVVPGITGGLMLEMLEEGLTDQVLQVDEREAIEMAHRLAEEEGLFCGLSSGANVVGALQVARELELGLGHRVVTLLVDSRDRYLFNETLTT